MLAATALDAVGHDAHVTDLGGDAETAAVELAVMDDATTDAGADRDEQQVVGVLAGAERELTPRRGVGVVLDDDREVDQRGDVLGERLVDPVMLGANRTVVRSVLVNPAAPMPMPTTFSSPLETLGEVGDDRGDLGRVVGRRLALDASGARRPQRPVRRRSWCRRCPPRWHMS